MIYTSSTSQQFMSLPADGLHNSRHALRFWATHIHWLLPTSSMLSLHFLLSLPLTSFPSLGVHSDVILAKPGVAHSGYMSCPLPFVHRTLSIISFTPVLDHIISFRILSLCMMLNNNLAVLRWTTASFFSWCFLWNNLHYLCTQPPWLPPSEDVQNTPLPVGHHLPPPRRHRSAQRPVAATEQLQRLCN